MLSLKACVLAAGFGTRLRPLTEEFPKPLIPFAGTNPLELALLRIKQAHIHDIAINAHYREEQIRDLVGRNPFSQNLHLSYEPEILGTGGCYNPLRSWLGASHLLVYNGDILSDMDLNALIETHEKSGALATMAMLPAVIAGERGFAVNSQGQLVASGNQAPEGSKLRNFACVQILSPEFIERLPTEGSFCVVEQGYLPALKEKLPLFSYLHKGFWHDLRTPHFFFEAARAWLDRVGDGDFLMVHEARKSKGLESIIVQPSESLDLPFHIEGPALIDSLAKVDRHAKVGPYAIIEHGAVVTGSFRNSIAMASAQSEGEVADKILTPQGATCLIT